MLAKLSSYYREWVPYSIRHRIRQFAYRLICIIRRDVFVNANNKFFSKKAEVIYSENVQLFCAALHVDENRNIRRSYKNKVYRFRNVSCFGASDIIKLDKYHYLYEVRDYYRAVGKDGVRCSDGVGLTEDEKGYYILQRCAVREHIEKGILLSSYFANNYYHFTFQCLAKLRLCDKIDKCVPLLVHESVAKYPSFQQLLEICNVDNRELIMLSEDKLYDVDELYYISPQMISVPNYRKGAIKMPDDDLYCEESLTYLREMMLPHMDTEWDVPERVFLQRRFASSRRGYNEEECEQMFEKYGFVAVRPETLTLGQQIALFNKAKCIVGASGAAFTNLIYGNKACVYVELVGAKSDDSIFSTLAAFNGAQIIRLCDNTKGELIDASQEHEAYHIDTAELKELIEQILGE